MRTLSLLALFIPTASVVAEDAKAKVTFDEHVTPIFRAKCLSCHNPDKASGGLDLSTYPGLLQGGGSGEVIAAGDPNGSRLYALAAHLEKPEMPPNSPKMDDASLKTISDWIAGGALENNGSKPLPAKPKADVSLGSVTRGRPEVPPMPTEPLPLETAVVTERTTAVTALATNPWSPLVAVAGQGQILLYNADTLNLVGVLPFEPGTPYVLKFTRNGSMLLAAGGHAALSGKAVLYNIITGEEVLTVGDETDAILAADISADQQKIAVGGPSKVVRIFSTGTGELIKEIRKHTDWVYQIEFSPDAVLLATGDRSGGLHVWESFSGNEFHTLKGHTDGITAMSWRDDSNALATGSEDGSIRLWEMQNGGNFKTWNSHGGVQSVQYAHDGNIVSCGRDRLTRLWDGNGAQKVQFPATGDLALRTAITHDNKRVITGDWTGTVTVWSAEDGKELGKLSTNPPILADRLAAAEQARGEAETQYLAAETAFEAAQANVNTATEAVAAAKQKVTEVTNAANQAKANLEKAKQAHAQAVAQQQAAGGALASAGDQPEEQRKPLRDAVAAAAAAGSTAAAELVAADQAVPEAEKAIKPAQDAVPAAENQLKAAQEQLPKAKAALDQATAVLEAAEAAWSRLEEAVSVTKK